MNFLCFIKFAIIFIAENGKGHLNKLNTSLKEPKIYSLIEKNDGGERGRQKTGVDVLQENDSINFKTTKIVVGLEYLGAGYDIIKANTMGDSEQGEDLGYRAPVIDFAWAQTDVGVTNSLDSLQPVGGWVRPKVSCGESENVTEIESISNLKDVTESDVQVDVKVPNVGTGSLNTQYQELKADSENRKNKLYTNTYYCFTYAAGIPPTLDWNTTEDFNLSVSELPKKIKDYEKCTPEGYKKRIKECKDLVKWMEFFSEFGTHVVVQVHLGEQRINQYILGGKLTRYLSVPSSIIESLSNKGFDVNAVIGAVISGVKTDISVGASKSDESEIKQLKKSSKLKFSVLGGIHPDRQISPSSIRNWKSTVPRYPMPIKIDVETISTFLPRSYYNSFKEALNFYITLNKALPWDIEQKEKRLMTIKSLLVNSKQVVVTNKNDEIPVAKCQNGKRVLFGFIINIYEDLTTSVYSCIQYKKFCTVDEIMEKSTVIIYTLCGNSLGLEFKTKYVNDENGENVK
ncbi:MAC/perforin, putative [Theileria annulata]|uniref:MAC/perforin, putative n=1 Tax=Theileria annulata TaxID=5874 RepID=Q4U9X5_THEAN|nr:MAC/perforin, putative [Theileria annulata]CAI76378.1 MAC/perforin, putative [Theileria annulata]|eukprot:XP_953003.1 MAC/perforin, putative [Theileria annulata]